MSPDAYLQFAAGFISLFLKIGVAYLLCLLLARLLEAPRQRFALWMSFMFASLAYWVYTITPSFLASKFPSSGAVTASYPVSRFHAQFLVPAKFESAVMMTGQLIVYAYIAGVLLLLAAGIWKRVRLHLLLKDESTPSAELKKLFEDVRGQFGLRRCELLVLPKLSSPATVYWWRPRILLPQACEQLDDATLMDILYHEMAHVARHDYLWSSLSDLACHLLFFHPALWQARKQMRIQREMACDLAVVGARPEHRADYASTLTRVARLCLPRKFPVIGIDFAATASLLSHRVHAVLSGPHKRSPGQKFARTAAGAALLAIFAVLCPAIVMVIAFAPVGQPMNIGQAKPASQTHAQHGLQQKIASKRVSGNEGQSLITESPAYRLQTSDASRASAQGTIFNSEASTPADVATAEVPSWKRPAPGTRSSGDTVESIIVATVGVIAGADADDHGNKRRNGSSGAGGHFQSSTSSLPSN